MTASKWRHLVNEPRDRRTYGLTDTHATGLSFAIVRNLCARCGSSKCHLQAKPRFPAGTMIAIYYHHSSFLICLFFMHVRVCMCVPIHLSISFYAKSWNPHY